MGNVRYTLMNKNRAVLDFAYDLETHRVVKILDLHDVAYAPPSILASRGRPTRAALDRWWRGRAIPASRAQIQRLVDTLRLDSTLSLAERNFGLSLSDRYWLNDPMNPQKWADVNFFDNDFTDDLGMLTLGQDSSNADPNLMSPNSTLGGDLNKKWTIAGGERILVKAGSGFASQEVYNEVVATCLHARLLEPCDFVPYRLHREGSQVYCACPNMLGPDEELVSAYDVIVNRKKPNNQSDYDFLVSCFEELGLEGVEAFFSKMFTCDFVLGNFDRHYRNFGVIRNVETLEYTRAAPIFDTGNSLWCLKASLDLPKDYEYAAKPFGFNGFSPERQLSLLSHFEWFDPRRLEGFADEAASILSSNPNMPPRRIERIREGIERQLDKAVKHIRAQPSFRRGRPALHLDEEAKSCARASSELNGPPAPPSVSKNRDGR